MKPRGGMALVGAIVAAPVASIGTALVILQVTRGRPFWLAQAIAAAIAAAVWMAVGVRIAPRSPLIAGVLFFCGTGVAWFFCRGMVHSTSAYYGLTSLGAAIAGGALVWIVMAEGLRDRLAAGAIPAVTMLVIAGNALTQPGLGVTRTLVSLDGQSRSVQVTHVGDSTYLWTAEHLNVTGKVSVEMDPGSGAGEFQLQPVGGTATRARVCDEMSSMAQRTVASELAAGHIPPFVTKLPLRSANCADGHIWALLP
jgi:hypothetical protein